MRDLVHVPKAGLVACADILDLTRTQTVGSWQSQRRLSGPKNDELITYLHGDFSPRRVDGQCTGR